MANTLEIFQTKLTEIGKNNVAQRPHTSRKLVVSKLKLDTDKECQDEIKSYFEDPEKYLEVTDQIKVGKHSSGPRYDENGNIIPFSVVGDPKIMQPKCSSQRATIIANNKNKFSNKALDHCENFERLDEARVTNLFESAKERANLKDKRKMDMFKLAEQKDMTRQKFQQQENLLEHRKRSELNTAKLSEKLSKLSNKQEDELLMNRVDAYRYKQQMMNIIEGDRNLDEKYGDNSWVIGLRRGSKMNRIRTAYVNVGSNFNPVWDQIHEYPNRKVEIIQRPHTSCKTDMRRLYSSKYFSNTCQKLKIDVNKIDGVTNLEIRGKNLLDEEYKHAKCGSPSKFLYKDINSQHGTEVFDQMYDEKIYLKNRQFGLK